MGFTNYYLKQILTIFLLFTTGLAMADRAKEIRDEMWNPLDKNFQIVDTPDKWATKSAIIIAQLNRFEYRRQLLIKAIKSNNYQHYRIKLLDKNAVNNYSELSYASDHGSTRMYAGFKVIKPNGEEFIIDTKAAVSVEQTTQGRKKSYKKLAIPNLEPGDIIDYYLCEESILYLASIPTIYFDPIIHSLPHEYPMINHKLQFRIGRQCYINLRSLNGAPELKEEIDEVNDEKYYTLEVSDVEGIDGQRWLFPYRDTPTIKFRVAYAAATAKPSIKFLLDKPGEVKSSVSPEDIEVHAAKMLKSLFYKTENPKKYLQQNVKSLEDPFALATMMYNHYRNFSLFSMAEKYQINGYTPWIDVPQLEFVHAFTTFLNDRKVPHDIIVAVPRSISSIDDVLLYEEIEWFVRVKKGNEYMYFYPFDLNILPGFLPALLEGTEAYALDGQLGPKKWKAKRITLPITQSSENRSSTRLHVNIDDMELAKLDVQKNTIGINKLSEQYRWLDFYDIEAEDRSRFELEEGFSGSKSYVKKQNDLKDAYFDLRSKAREENLKASIEGDYAVKTKEIGEFVIYNTGRYAEAPELSYEFSFTTDELVKKVGQNYMLDAGKLLEQQVQISQDELDRKNNIYYSHARSYHYQIEIAVPAGFIVQGVEKFNQNVVNEFGSFTSTARYENGKVFIDTEKSYFVNYADASAWPSIVAFLNQAHSFTEQKLLLKKLTAQLEGE